MMKTMQVFAVSCEVEMLVFLGYIFLVKFLNCYGFEIKLSFLIECSNEMMS